MFRCQESEVNPKQDINLSLLEYRSSVFADSAKREFAQPNLKPRYPLQRTHETAMAAVTLSFSGVATGLWYGMQS